MRLIFTLLCCLANPSLWAADRVSAEDAWRIGWPTLAGPTGAFAPLVTGTPMVDDLNQATIAWQSEPVFGLAKIGSKGWSGAAAFERYLGPAATATPASWAGPIMADGRIYFASYRPTQTLYPITSALGDGKEVWRVEKPLSLRLEVEDVVMALDAASGRILWQTAHPDAVIQAAGKRGGFQVTPAYAHGRVYSLGSAGVVRAHDAAKGALIWEADVGPMAKSKRAARQAMLDTAKKGIVDLVGADGLATGLVAAGDVVVVPTGDEGLAGFDGATGAVRWRVPGLITENATPTIWRHQGAFYVLAAHRTGVLTLVAAADGTVVWRKEGFGPNYTTLSMADDIVVMNVKAQPARPEKGVRYAGLMGGVRISLEGPKELWRLPDEPQNAISVWFDDCAVNRVLIRDGRACFATLYHSAQPAPGPGNGRYVMVELAMGRILAIHEQGDRKTGSLGGLIYQLEDRFLCRVDANHGALHGGRHPFILWTFGPQGFSRVDELGLPPSLDQADQISAYTTLMETPVVDGRLFERTAEGRLVCYDLRKKTMAATWELAFSPAALGLNAVEMPVRLWEESDGRLRQGRCLPPSGEQAGAITGTYRTFLRWEHLGHLDLQRKEAALQGLINLNRGNIQVPVVIDLQTDQNGQVSGTWTRRVPARTEIVTQGTVSGPARQAKRIFPTPWDKANPHPAIGTNAPGTTTTVLTLPLAIPGAKPRDLYVCLDHDGTSFTRALGASFGYAQSWQEVDASRLAWQGDRLTGEAVIVLNSDGFQTREPDPGWAGRLTLQAGVENGALTGTWAITWGVAHEYGGKVRGRRR